MRLALLLIFLSPANLFGYIIQSLLLLVFMFRQFFLRGVNFHSFYLWTAFMWAFVCFLSIFVGTSIGINIAFNSILLFTFVFFSIMFFPFDIKVNSLAKLLLLIAYLVLLSQLFMAFRIEPFSEILANIYLRDEHVNREFIVDSGLSQLSWTRFGGIYLNPNQCAKAYTFILGLYLAIPKEDNKSSLHIFLVCFIGLIFTGSRTGMGIALFMLIYTYGLSLIRLILLVPFLITIFSTAFIMNLRFVDVKTLLLSFAEKNYVIVEYILSVSNISLLALLFGTGDISRIEYDFGMRLNSFDSEFGYLLQGFGFMSFIILPYFIWYSFRALEGNGRVFLINLLWLVSSTILVNIRFCFLYFICLSVIYNMQLKTKHLKE